MGEVKATRQRAADRAGMAAEDLRRVEREAAVARAQEAERQAKRSAHPPAVGRGDFKVHVATTQARRMDEALQACDFALLLAAIRAGGSPNYETSAGVTPLLHAVFNQKRVLMFQLVQLGADVDRQSRHGRTTLVYAAAHLDSDWVAMLLHCGAAVDSEARGGATTAFIEAAAHGRVANMKCLLDGGADAFYTTTTGQQALSVACAARQKPAVRAILHLCDAEGRSASTKGSASRHIASARELCEQVGLSGMAALLHEAAQDRTRTEHESSSAERAMCEAGAAMDAALLDGDVHSALRFVKEARVAPDHEAPGTGITALICAVIFGRCGLAVELLRAGCNVNFETASGRTALWHARDHGEGDSEQLLLAHGAWTVPDMTGKIAGRGGGVTGSPRRSPGSNNARPRVSPQQKVQQTVPVCEHCSTRRRWRQCVSCGKAFCDECYAKVHALARNKYHVAEELFAPASPPSSPAGGEQLGPLPASESHSRRSKPGACPQAAGMAVLPAEHMQKRLQREARELLGQAGVVPAALMQYQAAVDGALRALSREREEASERFKTDVSASQTILAEVLLAELYIDDGRLADAQALLHEAMQVHLTTQTTDASVGRTLHACAKLKCLQGRWAAAISDAENARCQVLRSWRECDSAELLALADLLARATQQQEAAAMHEEDLAATAVEQRLQPTWSRIIVSNRGLEMFRELLTDPTACHSLRKFAKRERRELNLQARHQSLQFWLDVEVLQGTTWGTPEYWELADEIDRKFLSQTLKYMTVLPVEMIDVLHTRTKGRLLQRDAFSKAQSMAFAELCPVFRRYMRSDAGEKWCLSQYGNPKMDIVLSNWRRVVQRLFHKEGANVKPGSNFHYRAIGMLETTVIVQQ
jgi:ankyrin repeat protein